MSVESSTPETAAAAYALAESRWNRTHDDESFGDADYETRESWLVGADRDLDALTARGFTVVSGGEGLQHGDVLESHGHDFACPVDCVSGCTVCMVWRRLGAAPGTTAEPAPTVAFPDRASYGCVDCGSDNHTAGMALCPVVQRRELDAAAGATAPETTLLERCKPCFGTGRGSMEDHPCRWCKGSGVVRPAAPETTPAAWVRGKDCRSPLCGSADECRSHGCSLASGVVETTP